METASSRGEPGAAEGTGMGEFIASPQALKVGNLRSECVLPRARVRLVNMSAQKFDVSGALSTYRLQLSPRDINDNNFIRFPDRSGARQFKPAGDLFLLPPGQFMHSIGQTTPGSTIVCDFEPDAFDDWIGPEFQWAEIPLTSLDIESQAIRQSLRRLADEMLNPGFAHEILCELLVGQAAVDLARHCNRLYERQWTGGLSPRRLKLIDERVAELTICPTLSELADICNVSIRQLTRGFRASRNCSIGEYIASRRIDGARQLLASNAPIKEIAHRLGFTSTGNFSTAFRRATGVSPREYRAALALDEGKLQ
jgi:AraC family transcriptional regulator